MSLKYMDRAFTYPIGGTPLTKLILLKLADNANDDGTCWPSYQHIADQCECSRRTVATQIKILVDLGHIVILKKGSAAAKRSNLYRLTIGDSTDNLTSEKIAPAVCLTSESPSNTSAGAAPVTSAGAALQSTTLLTSHGTGANSSPPDQEPEKSFPMSSTWKPTISGQKVMMLKTLGVDRAFIDEQLGFYRLSMVDKPGDNRTQDRWTECFVNSVVKSKKRQIASNGETGRVTHHALEKTPETELADRWRSLEHRAGSLKFQGFEYVVDRSMPIEEVTKEINALEIKANNARHEKRA